MARSVWKNNLKLKNKSVNSELNDYVIYDPNFIILKDFIGFIFQIYDGKNFIEILIKTTG